MIVIKNVLVATDFSGPSESAVNYARAMARSFGASLHVLHVFEPLWITSADVVGGGVALATMVQGLEDAARKQLEESVTEEDRRELHAVAVTLTSESPAREIAHYASEQKVDLVVIGTHGRLKAWMARRVMSVAAVRVTAGLHAPVTTTVISAPSSPATVVSE